MAKIAAEESRVAATEKARLAEQERARLVAEGAQKAQQLKAEADAKAAEQARLAAETAKQAAQQKAAEAELKRAATESATADKAPENKTVPTTDTAASKPADLPVAETAKETSVAALTSGPPPAEPAKPADITKSVQIELRRVGCFTGNADGEWSAASQHSLALFNRHAGTRLDVKLASVDTLDAIKLRQSRVCPLACEHGFEADGDRCSKIVCKEGSFLNDDNECEKRPGNATVKRNDYDRSSRRARQERQESVDRRTPRYDGGYGAPPPAQQARPLTGSERVWGCNSNEAIMSGRCP